MTEEAFSQGVALIEAGAGRKWSEQEREVAWGILSSLNCPDQLGLMAASRLLEGEESYLTPMLWVKMARHIYEEFKAKAKVQETTEKLERLRLPVRSDSPKGVRTMDFEELKRLVNMDGPEAANPEECREYIRQVLSREYPTGHPFGPSVGEASTGGRGLIVPGTSR